MLAYYVHPSFYNTFLAFGLVVLVVVTFLWLLFSWVRASKFPVNEAMPVPTPPSTKDPRSIVWTDENKRVFARFTSAECTYHNTDDLQGMFNYSAAMLREYLKVVQDPQTQIPWTEENKRLLVEQQTHRIPPPNGLGRLVEG